jgi:hypothetical protein
VTPILREKWLNQNSPPIHTVGWVGIGGINDGGGPIDEVCAQLKIARTRIKFSGQRSNECGGQEPDALPSRWSQLILVKKLVSSCVDVWIMTRKNCLEQTRAVPEVVLNRTRIAGCCRSDDVAKAHAIDA